MVNYAFEDKAKAVAFAVKNTRYLFEKLKDGSFVVSSSGIETQQMRTDQTRYLLVYNPNARQYDRDAQLAALQEQPAASTPMERLIFEILRQYGAMTWLELQERYNVRRGAMEYAERHHILNALTNGSNAGYFEYSTHANRWFCGTTNPNL